MSRLLSDWLVSYLDYTSEHESPEQIHLWTGLSVLSASIRRQLCMKRVFSVLYPNIYVIIVAESARARKSVATGIGMRLLQETIPEVYVMQGSMTDKGLIKNMNRMTTTIDSNGHGAIHTDSHVFIYADELAVQFGYDKQRAKEMTMLLTTLYGSPDYHPHTTSGEGVVDIHNVYLTWLASTDPRNLKVLPEESVTGLLGRLIFVTAAGPRHVKSWSSDAEEARAEAIKHKLANDLKEIAALRGVMQPTQEAKDLFDRWYRTLAERKVEDHRVEPFLARCHDTALKIAMLISVSRGDSLVIEAEQVAGGIALVDKLLPESARVINWTGTSNYSQNRARFVDLLAKAGGYASRKAMLKAMNVSHEDFDVVESTLFQEGTIDRTTIEKVGVAYRRVGGK